MVDWKNSIAGTTIGAYTLGSWLREDSAGAIFAAHGGDGWPVLIKLAPASGPDAGRQFELWQRSRLLRHPHLLGLRDAGHAELTGEPYVYAVFEYPDEILGAALQHGPLSEPETRGVLEAALDALRYLHCQGLVHGAIDPDHVVAAGETVKLTTDALREPQHPDECSEDVRQLGELVRTLRAPEALAEPLATVVRRAAAAELAERWTLAEIARWMEPPPPPVSPTPVQETLPETVQETAPEPVAPRPAVPLPAPVRPFPKWIVAGLAILLFTILWSHWRPKADPPHAQIPPAPRAAVEAPAPPPASQPAARPGVWHVIAFTYRSHEAALKKAKQINTRWPDLRAGVLAPRSLRGYYLVALGDGMSRENAVRVQRRARSLGLPRDTFVRNYETN